jgi:hypothetical protein
MNLDHLALRVAHRHAGAVVFGDVPVVRVGLRHLARVNQPVVVILADGGEVSVHDVQRLLEPKVRLRNVTMHPSPTLPHAASWAGLDDQGELVTGRLVVRTSVGDTRMVAWAEVIVDTVDAATWVEPPYPLPSSPP